MPTAECDLKRGSRSRDFKPSCASGVAGVPAPVADGPHVRRQRRAQPGAALGKTGGDAPGDQTGDVDFVMALMIRTTPLAD